MKENIKAPRHWPLCGEFTGTSEFPAQRASNAENVSIWWRYHDYLTQDMKYKTGRDNCSQDYEMGASTWTDKPLWYLNDILDKSFSI